MIEKTFFDFFQHLLYHTSHEQGAEEVVLYSHECQMTCTFYPYVLNNTLVFK